jgi:hypothetical protein
MYNILERISSMTTAEYFYWLEIVGTSVVVYVLSLTILFETG